MATAEELLATVGNEENYIVIDSDLRTMTFPASVKNIGVENDKDVHKLNFMMPRYYSGYDLSEFIIHINYVNAQGDGDMYVVTEPTVEDDAIYFSWLVGRHACLYRGAVTFIVCLKLADGEGDVAQEYNTTLASLQVLPGLETEPTILETDYDIIEQLLLTVQDTNSKIKAVLDSGMTAEELGNIAKEQKTLESRMDEFTKLPDGSTTGDAELADIRVGADGTQYETAGKAVRTQIADLKSALTELGADLETYLPLTVIPASNTVESYPINLKATNTFPVKFIITDGGKGGYYGYGLYQGDTLVWGIGTPESGLLWVPAGTAKTLDVPSGTVADSLKVRNRNSRTGTTVSLTSQPMSVISTEIKDIDTMISTEYDASKTYECGDYCRVGNNLYRCWHKISTPEPFTAWKWAKISALDNIILPIERALFNKDIPWIGGESVNYANGTIVSRDARRTDFLSNIEEIIGGDYYFNVNVYKNGIYQGQMASDGSVSIPTTGVTQIRYAYLGNYDNSYAFIVTQYGDGSSSADRNDNIEIIQKKYESISNATSETLTITVGNNKQFTSLRSALEFAATIASKNRHVVVQYFGNGVEYDVMNDITSADIETASTWPGLSVPAYCKLLGMGSREQNKIALTLPAEIDNDVAFRISTINLYENAELENVWLYGKRCRYACHDDMMERNPEWDLKTIKNCRFTSDYTNQHRSYGAGYRSGVNWRFENCIFENINGEASEFGNAAFSAHNNNAMEKAANITFLNCQFSGGHGAGFESLNRTSGQNYENAKTMISFYGCKADGGKWNMPIIASLPTTTVPDAVLEVCITGCANNFGPNGVSVYDSAHQKFVHTFDDQLTVWGEELWQQ